MMNINATGLDYRELNETLRQARGSCTVTDCLGQRFLAAGISDKTVTVSGIPGNALGAYLNGAKLEVMGNAQDAVGDTMNDGTIVIHGNVGDAVGYAMRGGRIYVQGNAGYRAGIHMKAYKEKQPALIIGGKAGSFLGEYQAGGTIIVLGLTDNDRPIVGNFPSTGMHGGKMYLRSDCKGIHFPHQVHTHTADKEEMQEIAHYLRRFCFYFGHDLAELLDHTYTVVMPDSRNPYRQMYVAN
ncbi:MAG: glutamate synthase [Ruminococcus sp.]|nr:glutamate synthase [Ruminococcus sp.]